MGEINFARPDGKQCPAYLANPAGSDAAPALVVIQEWWGLNDQMRRMADRYAAAGYRALVPDLFRGKNPDNEDEANHAMGKLDFMDATHQDIRGALQFLKKTSSKAAVSGFCMGGALTILSALKLTELDAGVCFYGIPPAEAGDPGTIKVPLLCHFANVDDWCTPSAVDGLEEKLKAGNANFALHRYDAKHGFMRDGSEVHDAPSAKLAWERTIEFLGETLGKT